MANAPAFSETLLAIKRRLADQREKIRLQHEQGSPGIQVSARLTDLVDSIVLEVYERALADLPDGETLRSEIALVAHGGYGRRDVAPYSDVDLMILLPAELERQVEPLAKRMVRDLFDVGLDLAQSVRTVDEACKLGLKDPIIWTSLVESRLLVGSEKLFETFWHKFQKQAKSKVNLLIAAVEKARRDERSQYGETVYLLEPNVKRSRGGLRDIQFLRWVGFARYGTADPDGLQLVGALSKEEKRAIRRAREFLLRLRNEMHFHARKAVDVLGRPEQVRLAKLYGYQGTDGILPVEQFMREYFRHTHAIRNIVGGFMAVARGNNRLGGLLTAVLSRQVDNDFRVGPNFIVATKTGLDKIRNDLTEVLRLTDLANLYNKRIGYETWEAVKQAAPHFGGEINAETARRFMSLLSQSAQLSELLHRLHELGVLEKIIPDFAHAKCLLQFNEYHKYTVDEHCILAVQRATEFLGDPGPLGRVYQQLKQKRILHLALLIHDLGKGFPEDHSEIGLRIAGATAERLRLPLREAEALKFLVHKHLTMAHLAFRRDTSDDQVVIRFAVEVGSPEVLDMLFVLTAADISAVGPGVWTDWKAEVLADLYQRTRQHLATDIGSVDPLERQKQRREEVRRRVGTQGSASWYDRQIEALPIAYLYGAPPQKVAAELVDLYGLKPGEVHASGRYLPERRSVEYIVGTREDITAGVFHKLTGALTSQGLTILSAEINTLADGLVLDRFQVYDPDYMDGPPAERLDAVCRQLVQSLKSPNHAPVFRKVWRSGAEKGLDVLERSPTRVRIDNSTSDRFTILDIFTHDRMGLLYSITRTLFELGLSVSLAKIGTYLDQVVDVFYLTDQAGGKIEDEQRLQQISQKLLEAVENLERN